MLLPKPEARATAVALLWMSTAAVPIVLLPFPTAAFASQAHQTQQTHRRKPAILARRTATALTPAPSAGTCAFLDEPAFATTTLLSAENSGENNGEESTTDDASSSESRLHSDSASPVATAVEVSPTAVASSESEASLSDESSLSSGSDKAFLLQILAGGIAVLTVAAKAGLFGPDYLNSMIARDIGATVLCAIGAFAVVKGISVAYQREIVSSKVARKLIHVSTGPIFMALWPIFSAEPVGARLFAALVPTLNGIRLYLSATTSNDTSGLAKAVSRSGDVKEALGGPFIYVCILTFVLLTCWRTNVGGILALCNMAVGDGLADLVGRRFGKNNKWSFAPDKSVAGTLAFVGGAFASSTAMITLYTSVGCMSMPVVDVLWTRVLFVSVACAVAELLPVGDDNYTVPLLGLVLGSLLLPQ